VRSVEERPVLALDHPHARPHHAGELEHGHGCGESVGGERRPQVVDPRRGRDAGRLDRDRPLAAAEVVEVEPEGFVISGGLVFVDEAAEEIAAT
jgi:hypothetical protein